MKSKTLSCILALSMVAGCLTGCGQQPAEASKTPEIPEGAVSIVLSDSGITVDGTAAAEDDSADVYLAHDIVYYEDGQDIAYGAGDTSDAHTAEEAAAHTVVHISKPGIYVLSGRLSAGQIAIDLGEDAKTDPEAVVTLYLNGVDITCTVAPAVIFYRVYECDEAWVDYDDNDAQGYEPTWQVDTSAAGANVIIADGTENTVSGSYVAKIYKPASVVLSADGSEVEEAKKLHKYDGAFYSKMSMNVTGGEEGNGILTIQAENEGLDSELHLTINGGDVRIVSGDDGINTNEDGVSVTTINGGSLTITVTGDMAGEGDGIDSNGWLVINGGNIVSCACSRSGDSGLDSDMGIYLNGGTIVGSGNMLDEISQDSTQTYVTFSFSSRQEGGETYILKNEAGETVLSCQPLNAFTYLVLSSPELEDGTYTFWKGEQQLSGAKGGSFGMGGMMGGMMFDHQEPPEDMEFPETFEMGELPEGMELPEGFDPGSMEIPEGVDPGSGEIPEGFAPGQDGGPGGDGRRPEDQQPGADGAEPPEIPENGQMPGRGFGGGQGGETAQVSTDFVITAGANAFSQVGVSD